MFRYADMKTKSTYLMQNYIISVKQQNIFTKYIVNLSHFFDKLVI